LRSATHIASRTPLSAHSLSRRQQVDGEGNSLGRSFHRAPDFRTQRIPSKHRRSSADGRPPRAERFRAGKCGLIFSHIASVNNCSRNAIERLLSMADITQVPSGRKVTSIGF
jgi:hypothetical protein